MLTVVVGTTIALAGVLGAVAASSARRPAPQPIRVRVDGRRRR